MVYSGRVWRGGLWRTHVFACHSHEFIGGPTQKRVTFNGRTSVHFCHISHRNLAFFASFLLCICVCCGHLYPVIDGTQSCAIYRFSSYVLRVRPLYICPIRPCQQSFLSEMAYLMSPFQRPCMFRAGRVDVNEGLQQLEAGPSWLYV